MPSPTRGPRTPYRIKRLYLLQSQLIDESLRSHGLGRAQWQVLSQVRRAGELTQRALQEIMKVESATLTGIVDVLVAKGWLDRLEDSVDKRVRVLRLTATGHERWEEIPDPIGIVEKRMFRGIGREDRKLIEDGIERMVRNMEERQKGENDPRRATA
jgi:DNA-binding MarR family transcriptional regulator